MRPGEYTPELVEELQAVTAQQRLDLLARQRDEPGAVCGGCGCYVSRPAWTACRVVGDGCQATVGLGAPLVLREPCAKA